MFGRMIFGFARRRAKYTRNHWLQKQRSNGIIIKASENSCEGMKQGEVKL